MRTFLVLLILLISAIVGVNYYHTLHPTRLNYFTDKAKRRSITESVAVTGYAEPIDVKVVQSELPGLVEEVLVDFNDTVKEGQVLARLSSDMQRIQLLKAESDVQTARASVMRGDAATQAAQAGLMAAEADLDAAKRSLDTAAAIGSEKLIPTSKVDSQRDQVRKAEAGYSESKSRIKQAEAGKAEAESHLKAAEVALQLAQIALKKTELKATRDGIILNKDIRVGDTVGRPQFSLTEPAPALFQISAPLEKMQAIVKVGEADYSRVKVGQSATFRIDAYPDDVFEAKVKQIRNAPNNDRTAVSYATVLEFNNRKDPRTHEWMVKPRSTVNADIMVRKVENVLSVPNAALLFSPSGVTIPDVLGGKTLVWRINAEGRPEPIEIVTGVTDGLYTEVVSGKLTENETVITGEPAVQNQGFSLPLVN